MTNVEFEKLFERELEIDYNNLAKFGLQSTPTGTGFSSSQYFEPLQYLGVLPALQFYLGNGKNSLEERRILDVGFGVTWFPEELWRRGAIARGLDVSIRLSPRGKLLSSFYGYNYNSGYLPEVPDDNVRKLREYFKKVGLSFEQLNRLVHRDPPGTSVEEDPPSGYTSWSSVPIKLRDQLHHERFKKDVNGKTTLDEAKEMIYLWHKKIKNRAIELEKIKLPAYRTDTYQAKKLELADGRVIETDFLKGHLESEDDRIRLEQGYAQNLSRHFKGEKFDAIVSAALMEIGHEPEFGRKGIEDGSHGMFIRMEDVTIRKDLVSRNEINQIIMGIKQKLNPEGILITKTERKPFLTRKLLECEGFDVEFFGPIRRGYISIAKLI